MQSHNTSYEPMDVDSSAHSNFDMDASYNANKNNIVAGSDTTDFRCPELQSDAPLANQESSEFDASPDLKSHVHLKESNSGNKTHKSTNIKKFHIKMHKEKNSPNFNKLICFIVSLSVLFLSIIISQIINNQCSEGIKLNQLKDTLTKNIFGQSRAIDTLIEALSVEDKSKILFIYGGNGIGKTYTASLIMHHVGYYSNMYHYTMPTFMTTFTTDFMVGLAMCEDSIIIVDDLRPADIHVRNHVSDVINKSKNLGKSITIILIYNCDNIDKGLLKTHCEKSLPTKVLDNFKDIDAFKKIIQYEPLTDEHLEKCILKELDSTKLKKEDELKNIMKNFNVSQDGCKGVYSKMKYLEI